MRISSGIAKGREVSLPKGPAIRPTLDKVKQAIFNILGPAIQGSKVLDLFCGSGNLGLEAFSRGAGLVCFADQSQRCLDSAREHAKKFGFLKDASQNFLFLRGEAQDILQKLGREGRVFDFVFLDPPYESDLGIKILKSPNLVAIVAKISGSAIIFEHDKQVAPPQGELVQLVKTYSYGNTCVSLYRPLEA